MRKYLKILDRDQIRFDKKIKCLFLFCKMKDCEEIMWNNESLLGSDWDIYKNEENEEKLCRLCGWGEGENPKFLLFSS